MPRVSQSQAEIKHLVLLRKALAEKQSIEIYARNPSMRLIVGDGYFHGPEAADAIRLMIDHPLPVFDWEKNERKGFFLAQNPGQIFTQAILAMHPDQERLAVYRQAFAKLPRVRMRMNPTLNFNNELRDDYQFLYRKSLAEDGASIAEYLAAASHAEQLRRRAGIVIASYCISDFFAVASKPQSTPHASVVAKILSRFRTESRTT